VVSLRCLERANMITFGVTLERARSDEGVNQYHDWNSSDKSEILLGYILVGNLKSDSRQAQSWAREAHSLSSTSYLFGPIMLSRTCKWVIGSASGSTNTLFPRLEGELKTSRH